MIAIVTESLSCMNVADCATYGVSLAPMDCVAGGSRLQDRILTSEELLPDEAYFSVPPSEEEYRTRFAALLRDFDGVLCMTTSRKFSDSNRNATLAAAPFAGRVVVIDSGSVAGGLFLLVLCARHMVNQGYPMSRIKAEVEAYRHNLRVSFSARNARVLAEAKKLSYIPGNRPILSQHPVFRIEDGGIGVTKFVSGGRALAEELVSVLEGPRSDGRQGPSQVLIHYAARTQTVEQVVACIRRLYPAATIYERPITRSLQFNLGQDIIGLVGD